MRLEKAVDILEVAVRVERHSVELYVKLLETAGSSRAKELFSLTAAEEEKHLGRVRALLEGVADYRPRYRYPGEYELFVDGAAQRALGFSLDIDRVPQVSSAPEAVSAALILEKGVVAFYTEHLDRFGGDTRRALEELREDEKAHLERLEDLLQTYGSSSDG